MKKNNFNFIIIDEKNCPLYERGQRLFLTEKTLICPEDREVCLILVRDMTELLFQFLGEPTFSYEQHQEEVYNCSGCSGLLKFALQPPQGDPSDHAQHGASAIVRDELQQVYEIAGASPLMRCLDPEDVMTVLGQFQPLELQIGQTVIARGENNLNLYLIVEGELRVADGSVQQAILGRGEICGEMSYLGADVAVSTVKVASQQATLLAMQGELFGRLFGENPRVQIYMAKLLAERLRRTNAARASDLASCMAGRIDEMVPAELLQIFHMHRKTGLLSLEGAGENGFVTFRDGCIINASYGKLQNEEAIFAILAERKGSYRFVSGLAPEEMKAAEIGDFMQLLMEGVKRIDEKG